MSSGPANSNGTEDAVGDSCRGFGAKQLAHEQASQRDLGQYFDAGEMIEVFIQTPPSQNGGEEAVASYSRGECQDVRVFIQPGSHDLHRGSRVRCRVRYCGDSYLKALALYRLD